MEQGESDFERRHRVQADVEYDGAHATADLVRPGRLGGLKCHEPILSVMGVAQEGLVEMARDVREEWLFERKILQQRNDAEWAPLMLVSDVGKDLSSLRLRWKTKPYGKFKGSVPARDVSRPRDVVVSVHNLLRHAKPWEIELTLLTERRCARIRLSWKLLSAAKGYLLAQPRQLIPRIEKGELHEATLRRLRILS